METFHDFYPTLTKIIKSVTVQTFRLLRTNIVCQSCRRGQTLAIIRSWATADLVVRSMSAHWRFCSSGLFLRTSATFRRLKRFQMLPFGAQGSNQAIEDAGALGCILKGANSIPLMLERLRLFEKIRVKRASRIQTLSRARQGEEHQMADKFKQYLDHQDQSWFSH